MRLNREQIKHRWALGHNHLTGLTAGMWWRLLRETSFDVDPTYWHRAVLITLLSPINSFWKQIEDARFARRIEATEPVAPPLFVLGHWRSGTTHLHNLLALDCERFTYPTTYQVVNPFTFLTTEQLNSRLFGWLLPKTRPMDNMELKFSSPQEDELGLCLACLKSHYLGISFPRLEGKYLKYLTFENASAEDLRIWQETLRWFVKKLTLRNPRTVVLKSPSHTARIRRILEVFPDARFVHIHRDPYTVFRSSQKYFDTATWYTYMQRSDRERVDDEIIDRYTHLFDAFFEQKDDIPDGHFVEVGFDELERDAVGVMATIYEGLDLDGFSGVEPTLKRYVESLHGYKKNVHAELPGEMRERLASAWSRSFHAWDYPT